MSKGAAWRLASAYPGKWFRSTARPEWGFGYCKGIRDGNLILSYVDVPDVAEYELVVPRTEVADESIPNGTRVWVHGKPYGYHAGVVDRPGTNGRYYVSLVGIPHQLLLHQDQFIIRWTRALENPALAVAHGLCEEPTYYEARSALLGELVQQRRVSRGLTGAISAPIDLFQHQLDTAARVLADPVMRFLLADEVGLGKTIEAGIVIRQELLDDPSFRVLVLCPETLRGQWVAELRDRLGLGSYLGTPRLTVAPHRIVERLAEEHPDGLLGYDLIVADEAHNLLAHVDERSTVESQLQRVAGLLALSATPWRGDLATFRRLLRVVDPVAYGNTSAESLRIRLEEREKSAGDVQVLQSGRASLRQKVAVLDSVETDFVDDEVVGRLIGQCRKADDPQDDVWRRLADYLREIYRLSRRMIRHRRSSELTAEYSVAGRTPTFVQLTDPARQTIDGFLDSYGRSVDSSDEGSFYELVLRGLAGPTVLHEYLQSSSQGSQRALLEMTSARLEIAGLGHRTRAASEVIEARVLEGLRVVVVSDYPIALNRLKTSLQQVDPVPRMYFHFETMDNHSRDQNVAAFLHSRGGVLLADSSMEEGRNLQAAHVLVNLDIPLDANRLDQRIGRLDRYAVRTEPAEVVVFTETQSDWVQAQVDLMGAIGVFSSSVSTLQRLLNGIHGELRANLASLGAQALEIDEVDLKQRLEEERDNIDLLEELEATDTSFDFADDAFAELTEYEEDTSTLQRAFRRFTFGSGSLALHPRETREGVFEFYKNKPMGLSSEEVESLKHLLVPKTFDRPTAVRQRAIPPFRVGDPLVDWLEKYVTADERGRASAWARPLSGISSPALWLHCEFIVEFGLDGADRDGNGQLTRRQLKRRGESHLQPLRMETWTDAYGTAPGDFADEVLNRPFDPERDELVRGRIWEPVLKELPSWEQLCAQSADLAWQEVRDSNALALVLTAARESATRDSERRQTVLASRALRMHEGRELDAIREELRIEQSTAQALLTGIDNPSIRLVACGACVLWPEEDF